MKKETRSCPDFSEILDLLDGKLSSSNRSVVQSHLAQGCSSCEETMQWARGTVHAIRSSDLVEAPEFLIQKALDAFPPKRKSLQEWVMAKLEFDSYLTPALQGVRSAEVDPHQWTFSTSKHKIHLMLQSGRANRMLTGQIVASGAEADTIRCLVELVSKKKLVSQITTNENGEFVVPVPSGRIDLRIHSDLESIYIAIGQ